MVDESEFRQPARFGRPGKHCVKNAGGCRGAVLGVGGHDEHAGHAVGFELLKLRRN